MIRDLQQSLGKQANKASIICFTENGRKTAAKIQQVLAAMHWKAEAGIRSKYAAEEAAKEVAKYATEETAKYAAEEAQKEVAKYAAEETAKYAAECATEEIAKEAPQIPPLEKSLSAWTQAAFADSNAVIFVGAVGIAVRAIAPLVVSKKTDPAVLVIDEQGTYVISLLSGHIGGGNELARLLAEGIQAQPIITTATDLNKKPAIDVFAQKNELWISDMSYAKDVAAALLQQKTIYLSWDAEMGTAFDEKSVPAAFTCVPAKQSAPDGIPSPLWIHIGIRRYQELPAHTLYLVPKTVILGIGCRKDTSGEAIEQQVLDVLAQTGIFLEAVRMVASIDLKKEEPGLVTFCKKHQWELQTASSEALQAITGDWNFTPSQFVSAVTGVDNVCERSAVYFAEKTGCQARLVIKKQAKHKVTVACAVADRRIHFE